MSTSERRTDRKHHTPRRNHPLLSWYPLFFLLCLLLLPIPTYAQEPGPTAWEWRTFTADNSPLAPGAVWELLEGAQGRIWVRTDKGVSLYQGGAWQTFTTGNSPLAPGRVTGLLEDSQGRTWVGTTEGFSSYQGDTSQTFTWLCSLCVGQLLGENRFQVTIGDVEAAWRELQAEDSRRAAEGATDLTYEAPRPAWTVAEEGTEYHTDEEKEP